MRKKITRFFLVNNNHKVLETITWVLRGTGAVSPGDSRCVAIGEEATCPITKNLIDSWLPISISNPGFDTGSMVTYEMQDEIVIDEDENSPTFSQAITIQKPASVLNSNLDCYNLPLKSGYVEITMEQFNNPDYPLPA